MAVLKLIAVILPSQKVLGLNPSFFQIRGPHIVKQTLIYVTFYLADAFIQSNVQTSAYQGYRISNQTLQIRYNSYRIGSKAMNICLLHKVDSSSL